MQVSRYVSGLAVLLSLLLVSCTGQQQVDTAAVRQAIDSQNAKFTAAYNRQDAAGVAALYTQNATALPPNGKMLQGRSAIKESNQAEFAMGLKDLQLSTVSLNVFGDHAHEIGKFTITLPPKGEEVMKDSGKYLVIWKKQADGTWLIDKDIWNSSVPLPGM